MAKGQLPEGIKTVIYWAIGIGIVALIILILAILFGNLSGNVGFSTATQGYNDTQNIIQNYTKSGTNITSQFPVVGTMVGVAFLLIILLGVLGFAIKKMLNVTSGSNASFG